MSNHFPVPPASFNLAKIEYLVAGSAFLTTGGPVTVNVAGASSNTLPLVITFPVPGTYGPFDQDAWEAALADSITALCQIEADLGGLTLAEVQSAITIARIWFMYDSTEQWTVTYSDTMTFPPA